MRELTIAGRVISDDTDAFCVAELGHNHGGSLEVCKQMIRAAAAAGADAVKLQKRDNKTLYTKAYYDRPYTSENSYGATYGEHREALEFDAQNYADLAANAVVDEGIAFMATAFDAESAVVLDGLQTVDLRLVPFDTLAAFKIASGDLTNTPLLKYVAEFGRPMIVSTGAASQADVDRAVNTIWPINQQLAILQCTAAYPAPPELLNLRVITTYRERYPDLVIGLSSHFAHPYDALVAFTLGARIIERHFTLDRAARGTDHAFSLEPGGFAGMVQHLRAARKMLGAGVKTLDDAERPALEKMGKALYASRDLPARHVVTAEDIAIKSPGGVGWAPYELEHVVGRMIYKALAADDLIDAVKA